MTLSNFTLENYKAFAEAATVNLRPLTLIFGYNSAGKSALMRWLPLLRDSLDGTHDPLNLNADAARGASFDGLLSKFTDSSALSFGLKGRLGHLKCILRNLPEKRRHIVEYIELSLPDAEARISLKWMAEVDRPSLYLYSNNNVSKEVDIQFSGLLPKSSESGISALRSMIGRLLTDYLNNIYWLQAIRALPPRREAYTGSMPYVASDGSGITQRLFYEDSLGSDIIKEISGWYESATKYRLELRRGAFGGTELFSFCLEHSLGVGRLIELADTGEGMGQVLPIVGLLYLALDNKLGTAPMLAFEHPELHLHRAAEPALANLLCQVASAGAATIIAETHSESFLLAVQLALIEGRLKPEQVAVHWVRQSDESAASVSEITFDDLGRPVGGGLPPGVFMENADRAREVVRARRDRERNAS